MEPDVSGEDAAEDGVDTPEDGAPAAKKSPWRKVVPIVCGASVLIGFILGFWQPWNASKEPSVSAGPTTSVHEKADPRKLTTTTLPATTTTTPPETTVAPAPEFGIAPLTGMIAPTAAINRPALVAKIDADLPAMPQIGLDTADVVYEVAIEWGSRYLATWHSQDPPVIGPIRSARTQDWDLLASFGRPQFAYSGGNPNVLSDVNRINWITRVGAPDVAGYYRDSNWKFPNNLFGHTADMRAAGGPQSPPQPLFTYHAPGTPVGGSPVSRVVANPGMFIEFSWDAGIGAWRRKAWGRDHILANGNQVAPKNVVFLETEYVKSWADSRSPHAVTVGKSRAWVLTNGTVREGMWLRYNNGDPWNLHDSELRGITLEPGSTWVVFLDGAPTLYN